MAAIELPVDAAALRHPARQTRGAPEAESRFCACPRAWSIPARRPLEAALREVREETGITAVPITKLADIKYVYVRSWGDGERVFKIVSFYLLRYESGRIDNISDAMRIEVARAQWVPLEDAPEAAGLSAAKSRWRGKALEYVETHAGT